MKINQLNATFENSQNFKMNQYGQNFAVNKNSVIIKTQTIHLTHGQIRMGLIPVSYFLIKTLTKQDIDYNEKQHIDKKISGSFQCFAT